MAVRSIPVAIILGEILFLVAFRIVSTCLPDLVGMRITNALAYGTYLVCPMVAALIAGNRKVLTAELTGALCVATAILGFGVATYPFVSWKGILITILLGLSFASLGGCIAWGIEKVGKWVFSRSRS